MACACCFSILIVIRSSPCLHCRRKTRCPGSPRAPTANSSTASYSAYRSLIVDSSRWLEVGQGRTGGVHRQYDGGLTRGERDRRHGARADDDALEEVQVRAQSVRDGRLDRICVAHTDHSLALVSTIDRIRTAHEGQTVV